MAKRKYAFHCKACGASLTNFEHSNLLPDGSEDDLCNACKEAIDLSNYISYKDYQHCSLSEGLSESLCNGLEEWED